MAGLGRWVAAHVARAVRSEAVQVECSGAVQTFALGIGGPGLFLVAFLDSSFLSLPETNDLLVVSWCCSTRR